MVPAFAAPRRRQAARPHGVRLRAQRHRYARLESRLRGQARRAAAHPQAARAVQGRHPPARQPDPQHRPRAARWRGRSRPLLRQLPHRHPGQEEHHRYQGRRFHGPDRRQARSAAQTRFPSLEIGLEDARQSRRLRFRLLLRLHQQPGVAQRDAAAAPDPRSARAVRAPVRRRRRAESRSARARRRKYRRSILDFVTEDTKKLETGLGPTDQAASSTSTSPRSAKSNGSSQRPRRTTRRSIRTWTSPTASRPISPSTSS